MRIEWSPHALREWKKVAAYIFHEFGRKAAENFERDTAEREKLLADYPGLGPLEPLLKGKERAYRSLVFGKHNKLIYYVEEDVIRIADLWDTRREPSHLTRLLK